MGGPLEDWDDEVDAASPDLYYERSRSDVVRTQGRHLTRHPDTPLHTDYRTRRKESFCTDLCRRLEDVQFVQRLRSKKYGVDIADEFPISHTPPEVRNDFDARERRLMLALEAPTPPGEDNDMDDGCWNSGFGARATKHAQKEEELMTYEKEERDVPVAHQQPTPPDSYPRPDTMIMPPDIVLAESDSEDSDKTFLAIQTEQMRTAIQVFGQIAGKKRARSTSDLDGNDSGRRVRCRPTQIRRPYLLRSHSRFLKAN